MKQSETVKEFFAGLYVSTVYGWHILVLAVMAAGDRLTKLGSFHAYQTRHRDELAAPILKLQFRVKNPLAIGIKFINKLSQSILDIENDKLCFKSVKSLISKSLYSFEDLTISTLLHVGYSN